MSAHGKLLRPRYTPSMNYPTRLSSPVVILAAALLLGGCALTKPGPDGNAGAIGDIAEQQALAERNAKIFRAADTDPNDEISREGARKYNEAAAAYGGYTSAVAGAIVAKTPVSGPAYEQKATRAAGLAREFNDYAVKNTDPTRRPVGSASIGGAAADLLIRLGIEAWKANEGRKLEERKAVAAELRQSARWPDWDAIK